MEKDFKYKFSIIMSIYNVEDYIEEAIDSVLNQDIGFEQNVQLILVNDGSLDNSEEICKKYMKLYPNNIIYVKKKNGGLSSARNEGLKHIEGKYVNFFDPDDILSTNALSEVYKFFIKNELYIDFVTIPLYLFEAENGLHGKYANMGETNRIISLIKEPNNFVLTSAASFYKKSVFENRKYDEKMLNIAEDAIFNINLFNENPKFGYVCENKVKYNYRKRYSHDSNVDIAQKSKDSYKIIEREFQLFDFSNIKEYEMYFLLYELRARIKNISRNIFDTEEEYKMVMETYKKYLQKIPNYYLFNCQYTKDATILLALLKIKGEDISTLYKNNAFNVDFRINIMNVEMTKGELIIETVFNNYGIDDIEIIGFDGNNRIYNPNESKDIEDGPFNIMYGSHLIDKTHYRKFVFNLDNKIIKFAMKHGDVVIPAKKFNIFQCTKLELNNGSIGLRANGKIVYLIGRKFKITRYKKSNKRYLIKSTLDILLKSKYLPILRLFNKQKKYILINDRINKAGDNGEGLFKYINQNREDLKKNTYFVIDKKSEDFNRLKKYGKVVGNGSLKHKYLFLNSKYIFSSHNYKEFYMPYKRDKYKYYSDLLKYKYIWLQHGITKDDISKQSNRLVTKCDYVVTAIYNEKTEFLNNRYFYNEKNILLSGFPRYDYLKNETKKIIAICPTWRTYLTGKIMQDGSHEVLPEFDKTKYYQEYSQLLGNKELIKTLKKEGYIIKFILHPGMIGYIKYFKKFENENIQVLSQNEIVYSEIFNTSSLLITDFSSVFFDFAYLKKPVIFFRFDEKVYFQNHYQKGYFDYRKDGFGSVLSTSTEVIEKINDYLSKNFKLEKEYLSRIEKTFIYQKQKNSETLLEMVGLKKK